MKTYPIRAIFKHILKERQRQLTKNKAELKYSFGSVLVEELHEFGFSGNYYDIERILNTNIKNKTLRRIGNAAKKQGKLAMLNHFVLLHRSGDFDYRKVMFFSCEEKVRYFKRKTFEIVRITERLNTKTCKVFETARSKNLSAEEESLSEEFKEISIQEGQELTKNIFGHTPLKGVKFLDREFRNGLYKSQLPTA